MKKITLLFLLLAIAFNANSFATPKISNTVFDVFMNGDVISNPIAITPSSENTTCNTSTYTFSYDFSSGVTDSGLDGTCDGSNTGLDMFFSWTATTDALIWNDGEGNPGIIVRDASTGNQITCIDTFASADYVLSGWSIGQNLILQVYDFGTSSVNPLSFCLSEYTLPDAPNCATNPTPSNTSTNITAGIVTLYWSEATSGPTTTSYDIYAGVLPDYSDQVLRGNSATPNFDLTDVGFNQTVYWKIVPKNGPTGNTNCSYWSFTSAGAPTGALCTDPLIVSSIPYNDVNNTNGFGDDYDGSPGSTGCGTTDTFLNGDDVVYAYTATADTQISIDLDAIAAYSGVFVYTDCTDIGTACIAGASDDTANIREIDLVVTNGTTYYIVISTFPQPQTTTYTLDIYENSCINSTFNYSTVEDCVNNQFSIDVEVTDMGSASTINITDDKGSTLQTATSVGTITFGPYQFGEEVTIDTVNADDSTCFSTSSPLTFNCAPENDNCSTATVVTSSVIGAEIWMTGTTVSNTASGVISTCGSNGSGRDTWFTVTVPSNLIAGTNYIIATQADPSGTSALTDSVLSIFSDCSGTEIACDDDSGAGNFSQITLIEGTDVVAGQVIYLRVNEYGASASKVQGPQDGTFQISAAALNSSLSIDRFNSNALFSYYPNPVNNTLTLKAEKKISNISVYNMIGQEVYKNIPNSVNNILDMSNLQSGAYFVKVTIDNVTETVKVIKN
ncbi:T9SS type A sorting domain-containing protein [Olleya sp. R77988]|uniref:T9SS type A sorting domain-containing protein n=1 Tax=Olleya sp. R77988 TaxID=3093875 RepID=UPI0037C9A5FD